MAVRSAHAGGGVGIVPCRLWATGPLPQHPLHPGQKGGGVHAEILARGTGVRDVVIPKFYDQTWPSRWYHPET